MTIAAKELRPRVITGVVLATIFLALDFWAWWYPSGRHALMLLGGLCITLAALEATALLEKGSILSKLLFLLGCMAPTVLVIGFSFASGVDSAAVLSAGILLGGMCVISGVVSASSRAFELGKSYCQRALPLFVLVGFGGGALVSLLLIERGPAIILWLVSVIVASDSCAYFVGNGVGGKKLLPSVSPGKTISGGIGGFIGAVFVGLALTILLGSTVSFWEGAMLGGIVSVFGQIGDLSKSFVKRQAAVKDSGSLLPGHGGVLDRVDGLLLGAIVSYITFGICTAGCAL